MQKLSFILLIIGSLTLLGTEEQPNRGALFRKKRNSVRLNTGNFPINPQGENTDPLHYCKTYFNYKQNDDDSITISSHSKTYGYTTRLYKHSVTLSIRDLAHLEALNYCYLHQNHDPQYCSQIAGKKVAHMYNEIKAFIPLFFEYLQELRNQENGN